jgi:hypothetical protein
LKAVAQPLAISPDSGRLSTDSTKRRKGKINELIGENRNVTVKNVAADIGIGHSVVPKDMLQSLHTKIPVHSGFLNC